MIWLNPSIIDYPELNDNISRSGTTVVQRTYLELGTYLELSSSVRRSKDA